MRMRAQALSAQFHYERQYGRDGLSLAPRTQDPVDSFSPSPSPPPLNFASTTRTRLSLEDPERSARVRLNSMQSFQADGSGSITPTAILSDSEGSLRFGDKTPENQTVYFGCSTPFEASPLPLPLAGTESSPGPAAPLTRKQTGKRRFVRVSAQGPRAGR